MVQVELEREVLPPPQIQCLTRAVADALPVALLAALLVVDLAGDRCGTSTGRCCRAWRWRSPFARPAARI